MKLPGFALSAGTAFVVLAAGCSKGSSEGQTNRARSEAIPVSVAEVVTVPLDRTLPVVGTLFAKDEATIAAQVEGQVEKTLVDFGDRVTNSQVLARIDTASYEALARQAAANLAKAQANAANAEQDLKRIHDLLRDRIASASEFDKATAASEQARAEVKAATAAEAIAQLNLERSRVRAPFDGGVAERIASMGDYLKIGQPLFRLVNDEVLKFIVPVPERYAAKVRKEQLIRFTVDAWPGEVFEGRVYLIGPSVSTSSRSFNVGALVPNADRRLKASTFGRGELVLETAVPTPVIPLEAVVTFAGVTKVFVITNGVARARQIEVGRVNDGQQEVLSGLKAGEIVATSGQGKLYDGAQVRVREAMPKFEIRHPKSKGRPQPEARNRRSQSGRFASFRGFDGTNTAPVEVAIMPHRERTPVAATQFTKKALSLAEPPLCNCTGCAPGRTRDPADELFACLGLEARSLPMKANPAVSDFKLRICFGFQILDFGFRAVAVA